MTLTVCFAERDHVLDVAASVLRGRTNETVRSVARFFEPEWVDVDALFARGTDGVHVVAPEGDYGATIVPPGTTDVLVVRRTAVSADLMRVLPRLRHVVKLGEREDAVDTGHARRHGVPLTFVARPSLESTAEHTLLLILAARRQLFELDRLVRSSTVAGESERAVAYNWTGRTALPRLYGASVGLVGMGEVAVLVAHRLRAFGARVLYTAPVGVPRRVEQSVGARRVPLDELLANSDIVSLHVPATADNRHLADKPFFAQMRPGSVFVNAARGDLVDETALAAALDGRRVAAAGLDVHAHEPRAPQDALLGYPQVVLTPHVAGGLRSAVADEIGGVLDAVRATAEEMRGHRVS